MAQPEYFDRIPYSDQEQQSRASDEYEAGYQARLRDGAEYQTATLCWRTGWQEADRDLQIGNAMLAGDSNDLFNPGGVLSEQGKRPELVSFRSTRHKARSGSEAGFRLT